jgi:hypothetical protein
LADQLYLAYWLRDFDEKDWQLHPAGVLLARYGPLFQNDFGDQLRIELGFDSYFLPQQKHLASAGKTRSNIQSLLRLARELDAALPVKKRALLTESGEDFAGRLRNALGARA